MLQLKDLRDINNNIVSPGIYLVYLSDGIGNDSFIQQILITDRNDIKNKWYSIKLYKV